MRRPAWAAVAALLLGAAPLLGADSPAKAGAALPQPQQAIANLSLIDALVTVGGENLAGLFSYISETNTAPAFAGYLFRDQKALKRFLKRDEKDLKSVGGISDWNKQVYLYLVTINAMNSFAKDEMLPAKLLDRVSALSLAPALSLAELSDRRRR